MVFCLSCIYLFTWKSLGYLHCIIFIVGSWILLPQLHLVVRTSFAGLKVMLIDSFLGRIILKFQGIIILSCSKTWGSSLVFIHNNIPLQPNLIPRLYVVNFSQRMFFSWMLFAVWSILLFPISENDGLFLMLKIWCFRFFWRNDSFKVLHFVGNAAYCPKKDNQG